MSENEKGISPTACLLESLVGYFSHEVFLKMSLNILKNLYCGRTPLQIQQVLCQTVSSITPSSTLAYT